MLPLGIVLAAGCGSSGAPKGEGGVTNCQATSSTTGTMSWLDNGTSECAVSALATFTTNASLTLFSLTGATTNLGVGIGIESTMGPAAIGGTYSCGGNDGGLSATLNYTQGLTNSTFSQSCEITINMQGTAGAHATGTFSATLSPASGGPKSITNGVFDAPVTIVGT